jgi:ABC-type ATPase with predicted acetyltransferase domain
VSVRREGSIVRTVQWRDYRKTIRLQDGKVLSLQRSACVTTGETVEVDGEEISVLCGNGHATLSPAYSVRDHIQIGSLKIELVIKEITDQDEMDAYQALTAYHYRDRPLFGRTARLVVRCFHPVYPKIIGYIELSTPFYVNKSRTAVLDRPFANGFMKWDRWDKDTARRAINSVVRIARCVVYPEFRGVGLGQKLIRHGKEFARSHWQVGSLKPYFIEISADMLRYVPFAEKAGLHFIGETQGNLSRVATDLEYLLRNRERVKSRLIVKEESLGIVDQQVARMDRATKLIATNGWSAEELVQKLRRVRHTASLKDLSLLGSILSLPKPTYMGGLSQEADHFIQEALQKLKLESPTYCYRPSVRPLSKPIFVKGLSMAYSSKVRRSRSTAAVELAFGISPDAIEHPLIKNLSFALEPGQIAMVVGPSGSGKTTLLDHLHGAALKHVPEIKMPRNCRAGVFEKIRSKRPLIDAINGHDVHSALQLLGLVALSDAFVYLKRFDELSAGQQYRAMLAKLLSADCNLWLADEFCVNLDPVSANCVASRLASLAREFKVILIVATPHPDVIAGALMPDLVIRLSTAWDREVMPGRDFLRYLGPSEYRVARN